MKWEQIKLATLQKMYAAEGSTIPTDESTTDYLAGMPQVANEGLQLLSTAGKFIIKALKIAHNPINNLIENGKHIHSSEGGTLEFESADAKSYYFEFLGVGTLNIYVSDVLSETVILTSSGSYAEYRGLVANPSFETVTLEFTSLYPFAVKNVALYKATFPTIAEVPSYAEKIRYRLPDMATDFYQLDSEQIYFEGDSNNSRYQQTSGYFQEGDKVLVLDRNIPGNYTIYYKSYPSEITINTLDDYELPLDPEVAVILPLYMASQLYKDDDNAIATGYRNEFEVAFDRLSQKTRVPVAEKFTSESGWI